MITPEQADRVLWVLHEDTIRQVVMPTADVATLAEVAADLRPGSGGRWANLPASCAARRELLLADLIARIEEITGKAWLLLDDLLPICPPDVSGLE